MHIYLSIGPLNFDFSALISFIIGIGFGFLALLLIYLYAVIKSLNKGLKLRSADEQDIDEEEIKMLIKDRIEHIAVLDTIIQFFDFRIFPWQV